MKAGRIATPILTQRPNLPKTLTDEIFRMWKSEVNTVEPS